MLTWERVNGLFDFFSKPYVPQMGSICPSWSTELRHYQAANCCRWERGKRKNGKDCLAPPLSFAECAVDMRIGQWVVWFHLRTLCTRNGLDLSTLIHWISTGLGWDYSDSEILDTRPSVFLCQPFPLYQIRIFTNSDLWHYFAICSCSFSSFLVFFLSNLMLAMSIFEFFLSGGFICQKSLCFVMES